MSSAANVSLYDNKFMDYYNYLFIDLAGMSAFYYFKCSIQFESPANMYFRCSNQRLVVDQIAGARTDSARTLPVFRELLGSAVHGQPKAIQVGKITDRVQFYSGVR